MPELQRAYRVQHTSTAYLLPSLRRHSGRSVSQGPSAFFRGEMKPPSTGKKGCFAILLFLAVLAGVYYFAFPESGPSPSQGYMPPS